MPFTIRHCHRFLVQCSEVFMNCIRRPIAIVFLSGTLVGCTGGIAKPVSLDVALRGVEEDMKASSVVRLYDILSGDAAQEEEFKGLSFKSSVSTADQTHSSL
jgi:hypothetical protein